MGVVELRPERVDQRLVHAGLDLREGVDDAPALVGGRRGRAVAARWRLLVATDAVESFGKAHRGSPSRERSGSKPGAPALAARLSPRPERMYWSASSRRATLTGCLGSSRMIGDAAVDRRRHGDAVRHHDGDVLLERGDDVLGPSPTLASERLRTTSARVRAVAEQVERVEGQPQVLHRGDVEGREEDEQVTVVEGRQDVRGEGRRGVEDDVVVVALGHPDQLGDGEPGMRSASPGSAGALIVSRPLSGAW